MEALVAILSDPQVWIAFFTLTALELVLGIDNIIFISILVDKLPPIERERARRIGLFLAMFMRVGLLLTLSWLVGLTAPLFTITGTEISGRDLILALGGLFLVWKSTMEIHQLTEGEEGHASAKVEGRVRGHHRADHHHRHGVLAGFHHHRGGHGGRGLGDDRGRGRLGRIDDAVRARHRRISCPRIHRSRCWPCRSCWWSA